MMLPKCKAHQNSCHEKLYTEATEALRQGWGKITAVQMTSQSI